MLILDQCLTTESVEILRNIALKKPEIVKLEIGDLITEFELKTIRTIVDLPELPTLAPPLGNTWETNKDRANSEAIYKVLNGLSASSASDERLWVSLAFGPYAEYSRSRWLQKDMNEKDLASGVKNHWFAPSIRARWRDHSVSRLWWISHIANSFEGVQASRVLDVLYLNSELMNSFMGRPRTTSAKRVSSAILTRLHVLYFGSEAKAFDRELFRTSMKLIDLKGGKVSLETLSDEKLLSLVDRTFDY